MNRVFILVTTVLFMTSCTVKKYYNEWVEDNGHYYYYNESGSMVKNDIIEVGNEKYYFDNSGKMLTGWQKNKNGETLYFLSDGRMVKGWNLIDDNYYYFNNDGIMQKGWIESDGRWYYCKKNGKMAKSEWTEDGFYVDDNGIMRKGLGNGYASCVMVTEDNSFNNDFEEIEFGGEAYFYFLRKNDNNDEGIIIETTLPNGNTSKKEHNWEKNYRMYFTSFNNCNISGELRVRIFDKDYVLLSENSVKIKNNSSQMHIGSNVDTGSSSIKSRIKNTSFNDDQIKLLLEEIIEYKAEIDNTSDRYLKQVYWDKIFNTRKVLADRLNLFRMYMNMGNDEFASDVRLAENFLKELGLKSN